MNIFMKSIFQLILFFGIISLIGCKASKKSEIINFDYSYQKNWKYFNLQDTINIKVIDHIPAEAFCGLIATASITIGETDKKDTIRIINLCNMDIYKKDKKIRFIPAKTPQFKVSLPFSKNFNYKTQKLDATIFDLNILKTTYGYCIRN
jgi:hypothetical protein